MDTKKIVAVVIVAIILIAGAAVYVMQEEKSDEETLKVAYLNKSGYYSFIVGFDQGFFDDLGFKVENVIVTGSGQTAVDAVLTKDAQMAATGEAPFVNTLGKNPGEIIGLCAYNTTEGSSGGHRWIAHPHMAGIIPAMETDSNGNITNGQEVADAIAAATANGQGLGKNGEVVMGLIYGSTTLTTFKRWCSQYNLSYSENENDRVDVQIRIFENGDTLMAALGTNSLDILGASEPYPQLSLDAYEGTYEIGNSSVLNITSSAILCTTKEYYDVYQDKMIVFLEALAEVNAWIMENKEEAARICERITSQDYNAILNSLNISNYDVIWQDGNVDAMVETSKANGYNTTYDEFMESCPHRDIINGWYA